MSKKRSRKGSQGAGSEPAPGRRALVWRWWLLPGIVAFVVWMGSLENGFVWDDRTLIVENTALQSDGALVRAFISDFWDSPDKEGNTNYYRPIVTVSYVIDRMLYGVDPWGYHLTNLLAHALNSVLLAILLARLGVARLLAVCAGALFAAHPALAESIAWVSGRTDSLAVLWILVVLLAGRLESDDPANQSRWRWIGASAFALALGSKELAVVTPALSYLVARGVGDKNPSRVALSRHFVIVFIAWCIVRALVLSDSLSLPGTAKIGVVNGSIFFLHVLGAFLWPMGTRIEYGSGLQPQSVVAGSIVGALVVGLAAYFARGERGFGRKGERVIRASWLWAAGLVMCVPGLLAVYVKTVIGARLLYGPALFFVPALVLTLRERWTERSTLWVVGAVGLLFIPLSIHRAELWRSDVTLFQEALTFPDPSTRVHLNLGIALYDAGRISEAKPHLEHPMERAAQEQQEYMLGLLHTTIGCESKAEAYYLRARALNPASLSAVTNLVGLYTTQGRREEVKQVLTEFSRQPGVRRRVVEEIQGNSDRVGQISLRAPLDKEWCADDSRVTQFLRTPTLLDARGQELMLEGQYVMAANLFVAASRLDPDAAIVRLHLAMSLMKQGQRSKARDILVALTRERPDMADAQKLLRGL